MIEDPADWLRREPDSLSVRARATLCSVTRRGHFYADQARDFPKEDESLVWLYQTDAIMTLRRTRNCGRKIIAEIAEWMKKRGRALGVRGDGTFILFEELRELAGFFSKIEYMAKHAREAVELQLPPVRGPSKADIERYLEEESKEDGER